MSNTKSKTEIFEELSPKYFYDVSPEAAVKFLNSKGFDITTLDEITEDMVTSLYEAGVDLLKFARLNGLHNKPIPKVSTDKEKFPYIKSEFNHAYSDTKIIAKKKYENKTECFEVVVKEEGCRLVRGIDKFTNKLTRLQLKFIGCDEDTYISWQTKCIEKYKLIYHKYSDIITGIVVFSDRSIDLKEAYECIEKKSLHKYDILVEVYPDENYDITYYEELLNRNRYFKIIKSIKYDEILFKKN